jgi:hypothetical protein
LAGSGTAVAAELTEGRLKAVAFARELVVAAELGLHFTQALLDRLSDIG